MNHRRISPITKIVAIAVVAVWTLAWAYPGFLDSEQITNGDNTANPIDSEGSGLVGMDLSEDASLIPNDRVARRSELIAVAVVISSELTPLGGIEGGEFPIPGVPMTTFRLRVDRLIMGSEETGSLINFRQEGAEGYTLENGEIELLQIGQRYLVTARFRTNPADGYFEFPPGSGITLITSAEQEEQLVQEY